MTTTSSSTFAPRPLPPPFKTVLHFYRSPKNFIVSVETSLQTNGDPTAGDIVGAAIGGRIPDYENWDVASVKRRSSGGFDVFLPEDHDTRRRELIIEWSEKHKARVNIISRLPQYYERRKQEMDNSYLTYIENVKAQHYTERKRYISVELKVARRHYYQYFTTELRMVQQQLDAVKLMATLAAFDGIMRGLTGLLRADKFIGTNKLELTTANIIKYNISCVEDLFKPHTNCTTEEQEAKQSILNVLPLDYRGLESEVYIAQTLVKANVKSTILKYPQISKSVASNCINRSDMPDKFKEILGRWFIHSNPQTVNSEHIFGSEDASGVERLEEEVRELEDIIQGLRHWGDPTES